MKLFYYVDEKSVARWVNLDFIESFTGFENDNGVFKIQLFAHGEQYGPYVVTRPGDVSRLLVILEEHL